MLLIPPNYFVLSEMKNWAEGIGMLLPAAMSIEIGFKVRLPGVNCADTYAMECRMPPCSQTW